MLLNLNKDGGTTSPTSPLFLEEGFLGEPGLGRLREKLPLCLCKSAGVVSVLNLIREPSTICDSLPRPEANVKFHTFNELHT